MDYCRFVISLNFSLLHFLALSRNITLISHYYPINIPSISHQYPIIIASLSHHYRMVIAALSLNRFNPLVR
jgi:hypothetical protein